jgi:lipoyl(octanoyl) transferase
LFLSPLEVGTIISKPKKLNKQQTVNQQFSLRILPDKTDGSFANMANDLVLLEHHDQPDTLYFRHYNWSEPTITFGYSQKYQWVKTQVAHKKTLQLCRRPTGGGIVDHRNDWTYSLIIPPDHPFYRKEAKAVYRSLHEAVTNALNVQGQTAVLNQTFEQPFLPSSPIPAICFKQAEVYDVIIPNTDRKIAGAAMKRNHHGLLIQGSIQKKAASQVKNWDNFKHIFIKEINAHFNTHSILVNWPTYTKQQQEKTFSMFSSTSWNLKR